MARDSAHSGAALAAARSALAARDRELADADRQLVRTVCDAHAVAAAAHRRLADLTAQVEAATVDRSVECGVHGREFARFLVGRHRDAIDVVTGAKAHAEAKAVVLQRLAEAYRLPGAR